MGRQDLDDGKLLDLKVADVTVENLQKYLRLLVCKSQLTGIIYVFIIIITVALMCLV